jgi:copper resistance protein D
VIYVRAVHFASTIMVAGVVLFSVLVAEPAFRNGDTHARVPAAVRSWLAWIAWFGLALAVISGAAWLVLAAETMSDRPLPAVFSEGILWTVLLQTNFGWDWLARLVLACLLAAAFAPLLSAQRVKPGWLRVAAVALAGALVGTLAWAGHAAAGLGIEGVVHPAADFLHLVAAAAWVGTLPPLALLLGAVSHDAASLAIARAAALRFSTLGIVGVATLLVSGSLNTWYLAGSEPALFGTTYGRLLLAKVALFLVMVAIAAVNRLRLTPRLAQRVGTTAPHDALRQLRRNTAIEIVAGAIIIAIVAVLGTTAPGLHQETTQPFSANPAAHGHVH